MKITVVYHSCNGSTKVAAEHITIGAIQEGAEVALVSILEVQDHMNLLHDADTIVLGCPTNASTISAAFKGFMESTHKFRSLQLWKNKLAAGFTTYDSNESEKLITLISLSLFAEYHRMIWISAMSFPVFTNHILSKNTLTHNGPAENSMQPKLIMPNGMDTAELFGRRIANVTNRFITNKNHNNETNHFSNK